MRITLIQMDIAWLDIVRNIRHVEQAIQQAPPSDLYVLPEMWNTGFLKEPRSFPRLFESNEALESMQSLSQATGGAVAGSMAVKEADGSYRNRFHFVKPDGSVVCYDKHHLFTYGKEHLQYTPGASAVTVEWKGVKFRLHICYDLRFPIFCRNNASAPYDVALFVASWPTSRMHAWRSLLVARAIENQCYVCGINRIGQDPLCEYEGGTMIVDPWGQVLESAPDHTATTLSFEPDLEALARFRKSFPVLSDMDF